MNMYHIYYIDNIEFTQMMDLSNFQNWNIRLELEFLKVVETMSPVFW